MTVYSYPILDSTNDYVLQNKDKFAHGDVVLADTQTKGHGRFNRQWESSNTDNVYMTMVLKIKSGEAYISELPLYAAVMIARVLQSDSHGLKIKWPNDILIDNKKVAGILVQTKVQGKEIFMALGIGLNINLSESDKSKIERDAGGINEYGLVFSKETFINLFIQKFNNSYEEFVLYGFERFREEYEVNSSLIGHEITVKCSQKELIGKVTGFSNKGELIINQDDKIVFINSGEVVKVL